MDMMNKEKRPILVMPQKVRVFLLIAAAVIFAVLAVVFGLNRLAPGTEEEEITQYQYFHKAALQYQVELRDNLIYKENVLGMGKVYPTTYVEQVLAKAAYQYTGDKPGALTGKYQITAKIEGIQQEEKLEKILWSKEYLLVPETTFQSAEGEILLEKEVVIPFWTYNSFALQVQEDTGIVSNVVLTIDWLIKTEVQTEHGVVQEKLTPRLSLPLCRKYFEITGALSGEKEGTLTETVTRTIPVNATAQAFLLGGAGLCLLLILGLGFFVQGTTLDEYTKAVRRIFKQYEERLVALEKEFPGGPTVKAKYIRVRSMEDLVRIADEISRPVYYSGDGAAEGKAAESRLADKGSAKDGQAEGVTTKRQGLLFYVVSDPKTFIYELKPAEFEKAKELPGQEGVTESI